MAFLIRLLLMAGLLTSALMTTSSSAQQARSSAQQERLTTFDFFDYCFYGGGLVPALDPSKSKDAVPPRLDSQFKDVARAGLGSNGMRVIWINSEKFNTIDRDFSIAIFFHECAHHRLGHVSKVAKASPGDISSEDIRQYEIEADCEALRLMVSFGMLAVSQDYGLADRNRFDRLARSFQSFNPDAQHPSGAFRSVALQRCYRQMRGW